MLDIKIIPAATRKPKPDESKLGFGKHFTDHMLTIDFTEGIGWHDAQIVPYGPLVLDPASLVLHYAQEIFEGLKAYRTPEGKVQLFRPEMNARRFRRSAERLCMAELPEEDFVQAVDTLVSYEKDWVPHAEGTSLYIRPFMFATEAAVGVHPARNYKFVIILSPVGNYYPQGVNPVKIYVEENYVRATKGGMGFTKTGGNYAASIKAQAEAAEKGYVQVLWLDGVERKYVEEIGTSNAVFMINGKIVTAPLDGTILPGITRDSCLHLLRDWGIPVEERKLSIDEVMDAARKGTLDEAFATGTAAVISPVGELCYKGEKVTVSDFKTGPVARRLYDALAGIQWGTAPDPFGWTVEVK